ncbi:hypothetical protein R0011_13205 [Lacticaseibacillus rhamnosus R0011]|nr:hypothetical protein LRH_08508 [Lacticaseibacillus rhamnosus HN001]EHJ21152.1 hypothetical protein R0011_13205 [Lacticaseibacillus rhamnosus R0011]
MYKVKRLPKITTQTHDAVIDLNNNINDKIVI